MLVFNYVRIGLHISQKYYKCKMSCFSVRNKYALNKINHYHPNNIVLQFFFKSPSSRQKQIQARMRSRRGGGMRRRRRKKDGGGVGGYGMV